MAHCIVPCGLTTDKLFVAGCEYQYSVVNMLSVYEYFGIHRLAGEVCQLFLPVEVTVLYPFGGLA
jgi:hypothetical protein